MHRKHKILTAMIRKIRPQVTYALVENGRVKALGTMRMTRTSISIAIKAASKVTRKKKLI